MFAAYIMKTGVTMLKGETLLGEVIKLLDISLDYTGGSLAVVGEGAVIIGVFSPEALLERFPDGVSHEDTPVTAEALLALSDRPVSEFMSKSFITVSPLEPVESVAWSMASGGPAAPEAVFVVDDRGALLGVIEGSDVFKRCLKYLEK